MSRTIAILGLSFMLGGCCQPARVPPGDNSAVVPAFVLEGMRAPGASRAKVYLDTQGRVIKSAAYVTKAEIPEWVHKLADEKIGAGEDTEYELEHYPDGDQVYEIARKVEGQEIELSVKLDKTLKYIEKPIAEQDIPPAVKSALPTDFTAESMGVKEGPGLKQYIFRGKQAGLAVHLILDPAGKLLGNFRVLPGRLEIAR